MSNSHVATWSGSAAGSASFNSEAAAVGTRGTAGAIGIPGAEGILGRVRRERGAVAAVGVTGRIVVIRVCAELAVIVPLLVIEPRRICPAVVQMYEYKTRHSCSRIVIVIAVNLLHQSHVIVPEGQRLSRGGSRGGVDFKDHCTTRLPVVT